MAVNWVDRVPTRANRVLVTPENGGTPYYATITRADEPSVVGTPVNAANLNAMQNAAGLTASKTVYVSTTGSDTTGTGTQAAPFATLSKALGSIPKNLNGFSATINIAAGIYPENVTIQHFGNGTLAITGISGANVTINSLFVDNVRLIEINNIFLSITNSFMNVIGSNVRVLSPLAVSGGQYGVYASYFSNVTLRGSVTVTNVTNAIFSTSGSTVYVDQLLGSGITVAFASTLGSICAFDKDESTATTKYYTLGGGRIFSGSQTNVPNY